MKAEDGTITVVIDLKCTLSLWDALKVRLAGPAAQDLLRVFVARVDEQLDTGEKPGDIYGPF